MCAITALQKTGSKDTLIEATNTCRDPTKGLRERLGLDDIISVLQQNTL